MFGHLSGVIEALCKYYQNENKDVRHVWLSTGVDHFHSSLGDRGWGCGYRNFQMILSSLLQNSLYNDCLRGIKQNTVYLFHIPQMTTYWLMFYLLIYTARLTRSMIPIKHLLYHCSLLWKESEGWIVARHDMVEVLTLGFLVHLCNINCLI